MTVEGGTIMLSWNVGNKLPTIAGEHHRREKILAALWWKPKMLQIIDFIIYVKSMVFVMMIVLVYFLCSQLFFLYLHV